MDEQPKVELNAKKIIEALLFSSSEPITLKKFQNTLSLFDSFSTKEIREMIEELSNEYITSERTFQIVEIAKGYLLQTGKEFSPFIKKLISTSKSEKLSQPSLEVLAIIAFRQPVTRMKIDEIRGVDSGGIVYSLLERGLIEPVGKLEVPGRPTLFGVTQNFLKHFGLKSVKELPKVELEDSANAT